MLVRVAIGRQIKERQGWVDQAGPRRFLVSFDAESDSYAAAGECLTSVAAVPEIEPRLGTLAEVGATDEALRPRPRRWCMRKPPRDRYLFKHQ
jgi:hypothetical protein